MVLAAHELLLAVVANKVIRVVTDVTHLHALAGKDRLVAALTNKTLEGGELPAHARDDASDLRLIEVTLAIGAALNIGQTKVDKRKQCRGTPLPRAWGRTIPRRAACRWRTRNSSYAKSCSAR